MGKLLWQSPRCSEVLQPLDIALLWPALGTQCQDLREILDIHCINVNKLRHSLLTRDSSKICTIFKLVQRCYQSDLTNEETEVQNHAL